MYYTMYTLYVSKEEGYLSEQGVFMYSCTSMLEFAGRLLSDGHAGCAICMDLQGQ